MRAAVSTERARFLLRDAADIRQLFRHLLTHGELPQVVFHIEALPPLASQRAQDRYVRLADGCNCLIGEMLGAATLLGGCAMAWTSTHRWPYLGLTVVATVHAALIGKLIELGWTRVKILQVLHYLQRRLAGKGHDGITTPQDPVGSTTYRHALNAGDVDVAYNARPALPLLRDGPRHRVVPIRNAADIGRLQLRVATRWKLPRMEVRIDGLTPLDTQRAQARIARLASGCSYLPAALMATAVLLFGLLHGVWIGSQDWLYSPREDWWLLKLDWPDVQWAVIGALSAAVAGSALEMVWLRVRLLRVLGGLRQQLESTPP